MRSRPWLCSSPCSRSIPSRSAFWTRWTPPWTRPTSGASPKPCAAWRTQTQFIVITHNRGTIETADALYGVTVGDDAVSRVISLRLEEAREMADRVARENAATAAG